MSVVSFRDHYCLTNSLITVVAAICLTVALQVDGDTGAIITGQLRVIAARESKCGGVSFICRTLDVICLYRPDLSPEQKAGVGGMGCGEE